MPPDSLSWFRLASGGVEKCHDPKLFLQDEASCLITQGALGNTYFTNALRSNTNISYFLVYVS